ncbi:MAG: hypothetical protein B7X86_16220 [Sphingobacteriales bacterium 17-39-43]|uniref:hypothetical protein n=1 Tax=Daejeonella sp. TaxID=2805397 RepID=UPI000BD2FD65|nr:hypothetical protein [Daejeonella sp.]OYZ28901.1 MAG: hypothetical protein B7Y24_16070 [Sphingobacteriales bacterium 16-39-50]OZA22240.1 MAG: hypothetical protein B7X86_16220 [Sphingobacteriales bacterium 17-39-43]HQT22509.1 hypothetical protein [Daejeonella sp.]HQT59245.1 hypothetical protein [Daejeonella sp.]
MTKLNYILIFFLFVMASCKVDKKFNKERWLANNHVNDTHNPRAYMTEDLLENHLKIGITRDSVFALLGKPYKDGIENRLPKGLKMPDSLSFSNKENLKPENSDRATYKINEFMRLNSQPDTLVLYPVGWSTIDPNFLVIKFDNKGVSSDFWIEQH